MFRNQNVHNLDIDDMYINMQFKKAHSMIIFDNNNNMSPICQNLQHICSGSVYGVDRDLENGSRSNVNMSIENPYTTSYLMAIMFSSGNMYCF